MHRTNSTDEQTWLPSPLIGASEEDMQRRHIECRDRLDRAPFGEALAKSLWNHLRSCEPETGLIREFHRDYCGHGLIRTPPGVALCEIYDGGYTLGEPITTWETENDFIAFFARQSDFTCSGWDPAEPVFFTNDSWAQNNQRLTRDAITKFIGG